MKHKLEASLESPLARLHISREIFDYLIVGILTTIISLASYWLMTEFWLDPQVPAELQSANILSWIAAVSFAYFANRKYVFHSEKEDKISEAVDFYLARVGTLLIDMALMQVFISWIHLGSNISKLAVQVVILILNYLFSKLFVFRKDKKDSWLSRAVKQLIVFLRSKDFLFFLSIAFLFFAVFARPNFAPDTYCDANYPISEIAINAFGASGRFVTAGIYGVLRLAGVDVIAMNIGSFTLAILACASAMTMTYRLLKKFIHNKTGSALASILMIINPLCIEYFIFLEKGLMWSSVLLCVIAATQFDKFTRRPDKKHLLYSFLLLFLGTCCYQGTIGLFIVLATIVNVQRNKSFKDFCKNTAVSVVIYGAAPVLDLLLVKLLPVVSRGGRGIDIQQAIINSVKEIPYLLGFSHVAPANIIYPVLVIAVFYGAIYIFRHYGTKAKLETLGKTLYVCAVALLATFAPHIVSSIDSFWITPRSAYPFGLLLAIPIVFILIRTRLSQRIQRKYIFVPIMLVLSILFFSYQNVAISHYQANYLDMFRANNIAAKIESIEEDEGAKVEQVIIASSNGGNWRTPYIDGVAEIMRPSINISWSSKSTLKYYLDEEHQNIIDDDAEWTTKCNALEPAPEIGDITEFRDNSLKVCFY